MCFFLIIHVETLDYLLHPCPDNVEMEAASVKAQNAYNRIQMVWEISSLEIHSEPLYTGFVYHHSSTFLPCVSLKGFLLLTHSSETITLFAYTTEKFADYSRNNDILARTKPVASKQRSIFHLISFPKLLWIQISLTKDVCILGIAISGHPLGSYNSILWRSFALMFTFSIPFLASENETQK
jgi:hypothetical protein